MNPKKAISMVVIITAASLLGFYAVYAEYDIFSEGLTDKKNILAENITNAYIESGKAIGDLPSSIISGLN